MDLKTKRLLIRELTPADTDALHCILSDREVMRVIEPPYTRQQTAAFINENARSEVPLVYGLESLETGRLIGHLIWHPFDSEASELGWILGREHWGKGYARELTQAMLAMARTELRDVVIQCTPEQTAARHIAEKNGFFFLGVENGLCMYRFVSKTRQGCLSDRQREDLIHAMLGRTVTVTIDRPIGYVHVKSGITFRYPINYGFLPDVTGGDGDEQDVYILGVEEPLEQFTGRIIGVVRRADDNEDKLVAAPEGMLFHQSQIAEAVHFVEQYFDSTCESIYHKSCGVIPYRRHNGQLQLLVLKQRGYAAFRWSFPKGHMEAGESETDTALREMREECGLTARLHPAFRESMHYQINGWMPKDVVLYLGEARGDLQLQAREIETSRWVSIREAGSLLHPDHLPILKRVEECLCVKSSC